MAGARLLRPGPQPACLRPRRRRAAWRRLSRTIRRRCASLPGIGDYTAAAIAAIAFDHRSAAVDGNVERVVARLFAVDEPLAAGEAAAARRSPMALVPEQRAGDFAQAMMDLGAMLCTPRRPRCVLCPWRSRLRRGGGRDRGEPPGAGGEAGAAAALRRRVLARARRTARSCCAGARRRGLLGGMIELPSTPWREVTWGEAEAVEAAPAATEWTALPGTVQHGFTHFRLELALMAGRTNVPPDGIWARPEAFKQFAFPTLTKKLVNYALSV